MSDYSSNFPQQRPTLSLDFANSGKLDSRISYSRSSGGTYLSNEKALSSENLLLYSNDLSQSAWTKARVTVASTNNTAPDGTATASSVLEDTSTDSHTFYDNFNCVSGQQYSFVFYFKANGRTKVSISPQVTAVIAIVQFDLTAATSTVLSGSADSHSITAIGSTGWYKCALTVTATATGPGYSQVNLRDASGNSSYTGDVTKGMFAWGASVSSTGQTVVNQTSGSRHREYAPLLKTASADEPRFEFASDGQSVGLLIESQVSNLVPYSENFGTWGATNVAAEAGASVGPDGQPCYVMREDSSSGVSHYLSGNVSGQSTSTTYTMSVYAKKVATSNQTRYLRLRVNGIGGEASVEYDLSNGTVNRTYGSSFDSSSISNIGNGWYRLVMTYTNPSGSVASGMIISGSPDTASTLPAYDGDGYSAFALFGASVEQSSSVSSYIKSNSGSSTSRASDSCSVATSSFYTGGPVTIVGEVSGSGSGYRTFFDLRDTVSKASGVNDYLMIWKSNISDTDASNFKAFIYSDNGQQANLTISQSGGATTVAARMDTNNVGVCADGGAVTTDTSAVIPDSLDTLYIGRGYSGYQLGSTIKRLSLYSVALSDVELQSLTSS